ncbi:MAG: hypothetical protein JO094_07575 [Hyphomicrobiales bacterium]|nr:hypothetical protein [Hyphomicrobiales bacterium]MBV8768738.1 hypothetical protein [Hyphomicrobiales bacterium]MBV9052844.1 hypothetical protein [Hyphomicrobiales bacterium]MBV9975004.1 hypothetical protein [Hyphomicrobiales bacterium]
MKKRAIAGRITVDEGITTVDLHVGAQTVKLKVEEARELARELTSVATALHGKIWAKHKPEV